MVPCKCWAFKGIKKHSPDFDCLGLLNANCDQSKSMSVESRQAVFSLMLRA